MNRSRDSEEQVPYVLRQVERRTPVGDACRQLGVSQATFYTWKRRIAHLGVSDLCRMRYLEDENRRLTGLVADLTHAEHVLSEALQKEAESDAPPGVGGVVPGDKWGRCGPCVCIGPVRQGGVVQSEHGAGPDPAAAAHHGSGTTTAPNSGIRESGCCCVGRAGRSTRRWCDASTGWTVCRCGCACAGEGTVPCTKAQRHSPRAPAEPWSMDPVHDAAADGQPFRGRKVVDQRSRQSPMPEMASSM